MKLKKNVGSADKLIRYILALVSVVVGAILLQDMLWLSVILFVFAGVMVFTALFSFCGLYVLFGINTCPIDDK